MYTEQNGIHIVEIPVERFGLKMVDKKKKESGENVVNAGFFANFKEEGDFFTLPVGHLVCDYEAESKWVEHYCKQRGSFNGKKYTHDVNRYANQFQGKSVSTLIVQNGKASIQDLTELPACAYAIAGVPIMRGGEDVKLKTYVHGQGWDDSSLYATWHTFVGLKDDPGKVYVMGMKTYTWNMIHTAEAFRKFKALGFRDVIKLDGGGSFYLNADGHTVSTSENRQINTIITFGASGSEKGGSTMFKIALGAGHGMDTAGKRCHKSLDPNETREWWLNDRICDYTEEGLKDYDGYELLRLDDSDDGEEDVALAARVNSANEWGADFYCSVHHNASGKVFSGGGIVALTHPKSSAASVEWRNELYEALIEHTGLRGNRATPKATSDLYVLRKTKMPAVLLELGFMDSSVDVPIILTDEYARNCAKAIVEVIVQRCKLTKKKVVEDKAIYRVQVGAFSQKANAERMVAELRAKGYQAYTVKA